MIYLDLELSWLEVMQTHLVEVSKVSEDLECDLHVAQERTGFHKEGEGPPKGPTK